MSKHDKEKKKYYQADNEAIMKKLDELGSGTFFKAKEGKNQVRILPPWSKKGVWFKEATLHYGVADKKAYPCLKMFGKECPICNKAEELQEGSDEDRKIAGRLKPKTKYYVNIVDRKSGKVKIWGFSAKILGTLLSYVGDPDYGDITDPEEGYDVVIDRTGSGMTDTKYEVRCRPKPSEIDSENWENEMHNLDTEVIDEVNESEIESVVEEKFGETLPKKSKKSKVDEDEEDDEDDEEEEDKPRKKGKKHKKDEDDDKEDDDDDEDDEDKD